MLHFFYQLGILGYGTLLRLASLFHHKAKLLHQGQRRALPYLTENISHDRPIIWLHAASLGEFEQGRPLIEHLRATHPNYRVLLTFFSPSGYEVRKNYDGADYICYLPLDSKNQVRRFLDVVQPEMVFFVKYEFWSNYFVELQKRSIPLYMVSCIFRQEQPFFKRGAVGCWHRKMLAAVRHFFVQTPSSGKLLEQIGLHNYTVTGDTRFDRVQTIAQQAQQLPVVEQFKGNAPLLVVGSSWQADEELLQGFINTKSSVKVVFAPHELKEQNINRLMKFGTKAVRYTTHHTNELHQAQVLVVDCMGLLSSIYRYADVAYIGGGFGVGIHNTLEAAIYNIPVLFGPNYQRFQEAVELHRRGIAYPISQGQELQELLEKLFSTEELRAKIAEKCRVFMQENIGATQKIVERL